MLRSTLLPVLTGTCLFVAGCAERDGPPSDSAADLILTNGTVLTVDAGDRVVQALAVKDGRLVAVGSNQEIEALAGAETDRIDLGGRTATPGLLDAHAHFWSSGADRLYVLDLSYPNVRSVRDIVATVADRVSDLGPGDWLRGRGWDEGKLAELRYVYAADLDAVAPDNPVWLEHTMGHYGVANSLALEMAGVTPSSQDPPGGTIDRGPDGYPTGVLKESAMGLVSRLIPGFTDEEIENGMRELAAAFNAECMTGVKDLSVSPFAWEAYDRLQQAGDLNLRVFGLWSGGRSLEATETNIARIGSTPRPYSPEGEDRLISGGVKLYLDGSGGARTAWLYEDWSREYRGSDQGNVGYPVVDPDMLREQIKMYHDAGIHVSVHAIGDRAIDWVVDSYREALEANPTPGLRHGIIHANIPTDHALAEMADLQREFDTAYPEPQATFTWWIGDTYAGNFGPGRAPRLNPFRTYLDRGIRWAGGSDYPVTPFPARYGIWASVERETLLGVYGSHPYGTDESVDVPTALRSFTGWAARQMFLEDKIGSLEPGKYADIAVWDRDPYELRGDDLKEMGCEMTLYQGKVVFDRTGPT